MQRTIIVLGAADPEMREIERVGREAGCTIVQATTGGQPVRPGQHADTASLEGLYAEMRRVNADRVLLVEQPGKAGQGRPLVENAGSWVIDTYAQSDNWPVSVIEVDHHDPAQTWDPSVSLFDRSSLGQVCRALGIEPTDRMRAIGALDHDMPRALLQARAQDAVNPQDYAYLGGLFDFVLGVYCEGAAGLFGGTDPETYRRQIMETYEILGEGRLTTAYLRGSAIVLIAIHLPPDPTTVGATGEEYPLPGLPVALALRGVAGLSVIRRKDGVYAWRLQCASTEQVRWFLDADPATDDGMLAYCHAGVLRDQPAPNNVYGMPERGFAGGVVDPEWFAGTHSWDWSDVDPDIDIPVDGGGPDDCGMPQLLLDEAGPSEGDGDGVYYANWSTAGIARAQRRALRPH